MRMVLDAKDSVDPAEESNTSRLSRYYRMVDQHVANFQSILTSPNSDWELVKQKDGINVFKYGSRLACYCVNQSSQLTAESAICQTQNN